MRFDMSSENLSMVKGDTLAFGIDIDGIDGQDLDTASFACSETPGGAYVFQKTIGDGITKVDDGKYIIKTDPADTADLIAGFYYYRISIGLNGDVFTLLHGVLEIMEDITRFVPPPYDEAGTAIVGDAVAE